MHTVISADVIGITNVRPIVLGASKLIDQVFVRGSIPYMRKKKRLEIGLNRVCVAKSPIARCGTRPGEAQKRPTFADACEVVFRAGRTKVHSDHVNATSASSSKDWRAGELSDRPWTNNFSTFSMSTLALTTTNICTECEG